MTQNVSKFGRLSTVWLLAIFTLAAGMLAYWVGEAIAQELDPQNTKLSHVLGVDQTITSYQVSDDADIVVYAIDDPTNGWLLYRANSDGSGSPIRIDQNEGSDTSFKSFRISPDGNWVVVDTWSGLLSLAADGSSAVWLEQTDVSQQRNVKDFAVSPDSQWVLYSTVESANGAEFTSQEKLSLSSIDGVSKRVLSPDSATFSNVNALEFTPDSNHVLFELGDDNIENTGVTETSPRLYSSSVMTESLYLLDSFPGGFTYNHKVSSDGQLVVFSPVLKRDDGNGFVRQNGQGLFQKPISGGDRVDLYPIGENSDDEIGEFRLSSAGNFVAFYVTNRFDVSLYSNTTSGGSLVELAKDVTDVANLDELDHFEITPDESSVIFKAAISAGSEQSLEDGYHRVPIGGGDLTTLFQEVPGRDISYEFEITPAGDYLIFSNWFWQLNANEFYINALPLNSDGPVEQLGLAILLENAPLYQFNQNGRRLVFHVGDDQELNSRGNIASVPVNGGTPLQLTDYDLFDVGFNNLNVMAQSDRVFYLIDENDVGKPELFTSLTAGRNIAPAFTSESNITALDGLDFQFAIRIEDPNISDAVTITADSLPAWLTLTDNGDGTALLSGNPTGAELEPVSISLVVTDEFGLSDTQTLVVGVNQVVSRTFLPVVD